MGNGRILVLSESEEIRTQLVQMTAEFADILGYDGVSQGDGTGIRSIFNDTSVTDYKIVMIAAPLHDSYGLDTAKHIVSKSDACVLFITSQKNADEVYQRIGNGRIFVCAKPLVKAAVLQNLRFMMDAMKKYAEIEAEKRVLEEKLNDIRLIDRAKCTLIQYLRLTEPEAHKHMQKQAMDRRISLPEVAVSILKTYEYM